MGGIVVVGLCVLATACKKKQEGAAPPPAPDTGAAVEPLVSPAADAATPPDLVDAAPPEPPTTPADAGPAPDAPPPEPPADAGPAPDAAPPAPPEPEFLTQTGSAEGLGIESIELCTAVDNRTCTGAKRVFAPGEMVWALLRLTNGTRAEAEVRVSYLEAGLSPAPGRGLPLRVAAQERYTTFSKASKQQDGSYDVIVTSPNGSELARARFQVGTGIAAAAGPTPELLPPVGPELPPPNTIAGDLPAGATAGAGLGIASIELCRVLENRRCTEPATTFAPREMVWALLRVTNPDRVETELRVSYLAAGGAPAPGEGLPLRVAAQAQYTTFSKAGKSNAGRYDVVVCALDGRELARAGFEVR
jgi:hypothetical protein